MKRSLLKGAGILTLATFLAKFIGAFYRIPLTNILGAEGMGVYQLIFPIYSFILSTSSGALPVAISLLVSEKLVLDKHQEAKDILNTAMSALLMTGMLVALGLIALSGVIGKLQGSSQAQLGYVAIAPAIFFVSGIAVLRGWFQGNGSMLQSSVSHITEAVVKLSAGLILAYILFPYGLKWAVFGALIGVTVSEAATFLVLYIIYRRHNPPFKLNLQYKEAKKKYKEIWKVSLPITIGGMILPITQIIDSLLVVNIISLGVGEATATASYGIYTGYVSTLINLPIVLALSLGIAVIPQLGKGRAQRNIFLVKEKTDTSLKLALVIGVPFAILYLAVPRLILRVLYPELQNEQLFEAIRLLQIGAFSVLALSITQIYTSILQGLGNTYKPVKNMAIGAGIKIILTVSLLPVLGIYGVAIASVACFTLTAVLNAVSVARLTGKSAELYKNAGIIAGFGVIMYLILSVTNFLLSGWIVMVCILLVMILYCLGLVRTNTFNKSEILSLPFGKFLIKLTRTKG